ncbi:MAG: hypothetical protein ACOCU8_01750 [Patescibacteria group bacterium]
MKIKIKTATPKDALDIIRVLHKTWLNTYPNEKLKITKEVINETYKNSYKVENIKKFQEKIRNIPDNQKRLVVQSDNKIIGIATGII